MSERCENCGQTLATQEEWDAHPQGCECDLCVSLCWSSFGGDCPADDLYWRTRCLAAEAERDGLCVQLEATEDAVRHAQADALQAIAECNAVEAERDGLRARLDAAVELVRSAYVDGYTDALVRFTVSEAWLAMNADAGKRPRS